MYSAHIISPRALMKSLVLLLGALALLVHLAVGATLRGGHSGSSRSPSVCTGSDAVVVLCSSRKKSKRGGLHTLERNDTEVRTHLRRDSLPVPARPTPARLSRV
jgi:hypothetical protein